MNMDDTSVAPEESSASHDSSQAAPDPSVSVENGEERVPYDRFQDVNNKRQEAEGNLQKWNQWGQQVQSVVAGKDQQIAQLQGLLQQQQQQTADPQPAEQAEDPVDTYINDALGRDEEGQKARKTLDLLTDHKVNGAVANRPTTEQVAQMVAAGQQMTQGRISSMTGVSNQINNWVQTGMVANQDDANKVIAAVQHQLKSNPQLANRPADMDHLVHSLRSRMQDKGLISRPLAEAPANPLQPSGGGNGHVEQDGSTVSVQDLQTSGLSRIKNMDPKRLEALMKQQEARLKPV